MCVWYGRVMYDRGGSELRIEQRVRQSQVGYEVGKVSPFR